MKKAIFCAAGLGLAMTQGAQAGTDVFFTPLTQSAATATVEQAYYEWDDGEKAPTTNIIGNLDITNPLEAVPKSTHASELNHPWQTPAGITQVNLTSMKEIEADAGQSVVRVPGLGNIQSMWDMVAFDDSGEYVFIPHETPMGAGVTRYSIKDDTAHVLFAGDMNGVRGSLADWSNDWGAFDPATFTPAQTVLLGEEWSGLGRIIEVVNPFADPADIMIRELDTIPNVSHEGLRFSDDDGTLYFVDEWNSGSLYKIVLDDPSDYAAGGQVFVLSVDDFIVSGGVAAENWNTLSNSSATRTGAATWLPMTDSDGNPLTVINPFQNGVSSGCGNPDTFGGRCAADELDATPFGRPEDMEVGRLANGNEAIYFAATSERTVYSVEELGNGDAMVRVFVSDAGTPKNLGFEPTTASLNSPDNLAQDALGNIYIIEDAPNGSNIGGDIWFSRDTDGDGVAESADHFLSIVADGAEATGMIFNPTNPTQFVVAVQHPDSTNLDVYPEGFGDALWLFDLTGVVPPVCDKGNAGGKGNGVKTCSNAGDSQFVKNLAKQ